MPAIAGQTLRWSHGIRPHWQEGLGQKLRQHRNNKLKHPLSSMNFWVATDVKYKCNKCRGWEQDKKKIYMLTCIVEIMSLTKIISGTVSAVPEMGGLLGLPLVSTWVHMHRYKHPHTCACADHTQKISSFKKSMLPTKLLSDNHLKKIKQF